AAILLTGALATEFLEIDAPFCIRPEFVDNRADATSKIECAGQCDATPDCQAASLADAPGSCSKYVRDCDCTRRAAVLMKRQPGVPPGALCPTGYADDYCGAKTSNVAKTLIDSEPGFTIMADVTDMNEIIHLESIFTRGQPQEGAAGRTQPPGSEEPAGGWIWDSCRLSISADLWMENQPNNAGKIENATVSGAGIVGINDGRSVQISLVNSYNGTLADMEQQLELSDLDQATVTSSSSQLETVQPFTIEDSPPLEPGSTLLQPDSGTMMCASRASPQPVGRCYRNVAVKRKNPQEPETEGVEEDSAPAMRSTDEENDTSATEGPSTDGGMEGDSSEFGVGEQTDSVGNAEKPATQRQPSWISAPRALLKTMRRMFAGVTNDSDALLRDGGRHDDKSASTPHPVTGELVKEGVIIGDVDIFAPRMQREFILPVKDSLIEAFLKEPGVFRAICYRTRCQVEVTRRLLNRKLCIGGRWHKYMIIRIVGPTFKCIENCDTLLQKAVPSYKWRKTYHTAAVCRMYLREDVPDNAELYFGYQRTGGSSHRFGALKLESPYRQTATRTVGNSPWKFGLFKVGKLTFSAPAVKLCMKHVYPSLGYQTTSNLEPEYQGVNAVERITALHDQFQMGRQSALALKRALTIPVCR
uniref:VWFD domain-containing protein n=1 Tax=Macrostomum lignano TaxID=282301 RepID=A0A1I8H7H6_9PLAT